MLILTRSPAVSHRRLISANFFTCAAKLK